MMAKEHFERNRSSILLGSAHDSVTALCRKNGHVNVGTIGHVSHGRTSLAAAVLRAVRDHLGGEIGSNANPDYNPYRMCSGAIPSTPPGYAELIKDTPLADYQVDKVRLEDGKVVFETKELP